MSSDGELAMAWDEAYQEAERRIEVARQGGLLELDLSNMQLTELPESLAQLSRLERLYLDGNRLTALPEFLAQLS